jgi:chemotaxis signal transduction protein
MQLLGPTGTSGSQGFATFLTEVGLFALPVGCMVEALPGKEIRPVSLGTSEFRVGAIARRRDADVQGYVWVYDMNALLGGTARNGTEHCEVIILRHRDVELGFVVGNLHAVPAFEEHEIVPTARFAGGGDPLVSHLIRANGGELLIQVLDPHRLIEGVAAGSEDELTALAESNVRIAPQSDGGKSNRLHG